MKKEAGKMNELIGYDAIGLSELIRKDEITTVELLENIIDRIEKVNPKLNAVIYKMYDLARTSAEDLDSVIKTAKASNSSLFGVPFLLKDLIAECKDTPFNEGSRAVQGYISKLDSEIVKRHKASGLIIVGKTNTAEFGVLTTTEPPAHGPTLNPWDPSLTPGGSSGGSAAAVAAGIMPMAHGCDGGGSIRIPASCCGLFGLKPTRGRNPLGPLFGDLGGGIIHEHAVTCTVRDSAALLDVTSGPDFGDPYYAPPKERPFLEEVGRDVGRLKIGFLTSVPEGWNEETALHPDCEASVKDAAQLCEDLGHRVEEVSATQLSHADLPKTFVLVFSCFVGHIIAYWERELGKKIIKDELEPPTWDLYQESLKTTGAAYFLAKEELQCFSRKMANWYHKENYDLLLSPTMRIPPTKIGSLQPSPDDPMKWIRIALSFAAFTRTQNITGDPSMSVPLFWNENNIPIGVQFAGRFGDESTLFRLAAQLEQARPWAGKKPPIHCANTF
jgi:amidase